MAEDRWYSLDVPILEFIDSRRQKAGVITAREIAEAIKADPIEVGTELEGLCEDNYVAAKLYKPGAAPRGEWQLNRCALADKGLRVVGARPSGDPYEALVKLLDRRIEETEDADQKSKLQKFMSSVGDIGKATVSGLLVEWAKGIH